MTQTSENSLQNLKTQQKLFIVMGGDIKSEQKKMSIQDIEKLRKNYRFMYVGFACMNWAHGNTLGMAWQKALEQMESFVKSKMKNINNPVNIELIKIHTEFKREMSKHIMTSHNTNMTVEGAEAKNFLEWGELYMKKSKKPLDDIYKKYMPKQTVQKTPLVKQFDIAKQKADQLMQQILLQRKINQRAA